MSRTRRFVACFALALIFAGNFANSAARGEETAVHKVALHVNDNDKRRMTITLNNAENIYKYYASKGQKVMVRIVAYNAGLHMFRGDTSPVKERIAQMALQYDGLSFAACGNTYRKMSKKEGKKFPLIDEAKVVPSGVIELIELQEQGWAYVKP